MEPSEDTFNVFQIISTSFNVKIREDAWSMWNIVKPYSAYATWILPGSRLPPLCITMPTLVMIVKKPSPAANPAIRNSAQSGLTAFNMFFHKLSMLYHFIISLNILKNTIWDTNIKEAVFTTCGLDGIVHGWRCEKGNMLKLMRLTLPNSLRDKWTGPRTGTVFLSID